ncbi:response regulator transcription factor [Streptomyces sp. 549]|uniref:response regulator transcription factor n=1 Tax=Streptomyces sp. 549 TaxID=3049076 RepID=UPI0024C4608F|nr:response regulator transcription factor [Streptomyces sp. 549]MDK1473869.1 response regulator transcription factor [Streptomyces sp. 549]
MTRVLVAGDERMVRELMVAALDREPDLRVVAEVATGAEVAPVACRVGPDVAVLSASLRDLDGVDAVTALRRSVPGCRSLVLAARPSPGLVRSALAAGASGLVHTDLSLAELLGAVRGVAAGRLVVAPELLGAAAEVGRSPLSARETDVLRRVAEGRHPTDIARELSLTVGTVRNHLSAVLRKLDARTQIEALAIARDRDWLRPG